MKHRIPSSALFIFNICGLSLLVSQQADARWVRPSTNRVKIENYTNSYLVYGASKSFFRSNKFCENALNRADTSERSAARVCYNMGGRPIESSFERKAGSGKEINVTTVGQTANRARTLNFYTHCEEIISFECSDVPATSQFKAGKIHDDLTKRGQDVQPLVTLFEEYVSQEAVSPPSPLSVLWEAKIPSPLFDTSLASISLAPYAELFAYIRALDLIGYLDSINEKLTIHPSDVEQIKKYTKNNQLLTQLFKEAKENPDLGSIPAGICSWDGASNTYDGEIPSAEDLSKIFLESEEQLRLKYVRASTDDYRKFVASTKSIRDGASYIRLVAVPRCEKKLNHYGFYRALLKKLLSNTLTNELLDRLSLPVMAAAFRTTTWEHLNRNDLADMHEEIDQQLKSIQSIKNSPDVVRDLDFGDYSL